MKTIIAGSRNFTDEYELVVSMPLVPWDITEVVSGGARGADILGETWADTHNIPVKRFIPEWDTYGKAAGHMRNRDMAEYAEALVAFWDGWSAGTRNMIDTAKRLGLFVHIFMV